MTIEVHDSQSLPVARYLVDDLHHFAPATLEWLMEGELYELLARSAYDTNEEIRSWLRGDSEWCGSPHRRSRTPQEHDMMLGFALSSPAAQWWDHPVSARPQIWITPGDDGPSPHPERAPLAEKPSAQLWTSSMLEGVPSAWWPIMTGELASRYSAGWTQWLVTPRAGARVYEVNELRDWRRICECFPGATTDGFVWPDWVRVADVFDGVHVTGQGLLRAQGVPVATTSGDAMLWGWDVESTAWLTWCFASVERVEAVPARETAISVEHRRIIEKQERERFPNSFDRFRARVRVFQP